MEVTTPAYGTLSKLPREIRQHIYGNVFEDGSYVGHSEKLPGVVHEATETGLLTTSHAIREESRDLFIAKATAIYDLRFEPNFSFSEIKLGENTSRVQNVKLCISVPRSAFVAAIGTDRYHAAMRGRPTGIERIYKRTLMFFVTFWNLFWARVKAQALIRKARGLT
ncbi:uncharacterized protein KY384_002953 [Bacidia gigantensis]|uniref:uncharacterized protein n=1 Tax=Bacidia gigantensis TaxID=2732470 RepID=UPI001D051BA6|nr:uncharacterized protein KY384_002953 [Bacidia gigantensis]KAG8531324.1 hypothetical protein KY384_002953 [Bacidia gigantensis]